MNCDDAELLRQYFEERSESAFTELVNRHVDLVDPSAFRTTTDEHGVFVFPKVPPGSLEILVWQNDPDPRGGQFGMILTEVRLSSGQTSHLILTNAVRFAR